MRTDKVSWLAAAAAVLLSLAAGSASAAPFVQCPVAKAPLSNDPANQTAEVDPLAVANWESSHPGAVWNGTVLPGQADCKHLAAGDGFITMADSTTGDARDPSHLPGYGHTLYTFGFGDVTNVPVRDVMGAGAWNANAPAPTIEMTEGDDYFLTLTNVSMLTRPDLFDPHSVHFHGFPQASSIFDGMPEGSIAVFAGSSITYYYKPRNPGTYFYHCHVEATEHIQMGMYGNLWVKPIQDRVCAGHFAGPPNNLSPPGYCFKDAAKTQPWAGFAYDDGDGSTGYDKAYPIQLSSIDPFFHDQDLRIQPPPLALVDDKYGTINGRSYPDTIANDPGKVVVAGDAATGAPADPLPLTSILDNLSNQIQPVDTAGQSCIGPNLPAGCNPNFGNPAFVDVPPGGSCAMAPTNACSISGAACATVGASCGAAGGVCSTFCSVPKLALAEPNKTPYYQGTYYGNTYAGGKTPSTQRVGSFMQARAGERILLRISNLSVTRPFTLAAYGFTLKVVGIHARQLRNPATPFGPRRDLAYDTSSVTLGGGESLDAIVDTTGLAPGRYFLYTANLNFLSNFREDFGGMMTELEVL